MISPWAKFGIFVTLNWSESATVDNARIDAVINPNPTDSRKSCRIVPPSFASVMDVYNGVKHTYDVATWPDHSRRVRWQHRGAWRERDCAAGPGPQEHGVAAVRNARASRLAGPCAGLRQVPARHAAPPA